jgi:hypothetical protein
LDRINPEGWQGLKGVTLMNALKWRVAITTPWPDVDDRHAPHLAGPEDSCHPSWRIGRSQAEIRRACLADEAHIGYPQKEARERDAFTSTVDGSVPRSFDGR